MLQSLPWLCMCTSVSAQKVVSVERNHRIGIMFTYLLLGSHRINELEASIGVSTSRALLTSEIIVLPKQISSSI